MSFYGSIADDELFDLVGRRADQFCPCSTRNRLAARFNCASCIPLQPTASGKATGLLGHIHRRDARTDSRGD